MLMDFNGIEALLGLPEFRVINQVIRPDRLDLHLERRGHVSDLYFHWEVCHADSTIERRCPWYSFP